MKSSLTVHWLWLPTWLGEMVKYLSASRELCVTVISSRICFWCCYRPGWCPFLEHSPHFSRDEEISLITPSERRYFPGLIGQTMIFWKIRGFGHSKNIPRIFLLPPNSTTAWPKKCLTCCVAMPFLWEFLVPFGVLWMCDSSMACQCSRRGELFSLPKPIPV